jgi:hypothetical protein
LPALVESMKVEASGTSTLAKAGLGLLTVRAHSQAMTVSFRPDVFLQVGRSCTIAAVTSIFG